MIYKFKRGDYIQISSVEKMDNSWLGRVGKIKKRNKGKRQGKLSWDAIMYPDTIIYLYGDEMTKISKEEYFLEVL